jgi:hypothetical protein
VNGDSGKWSIQRLSTGQVWIEFYDPTGRTVLSRAVFDEPAIREFYDTLTEVMREVDR